MCRPTYTYVYILCVPVKGLVSPTDLIPSLLYNTEDTRPTKSDLY